MSSRRNKLFFKKLLSLFSVVRGYNILIVVIAQYLSSIYILAENETPKAVLFDGQLFLLVLASSLTIAAGYIINNFYDSEKDLINRPWKSMIDRLLSQQTKLTGYFILNFLTVILASSVSFMAVLFFSAYIFLIWIYSHKLKKFPFIGNMVASALAIAPFFIVFVYYRNFQPVIFVHGLFLLFLISMREITKDLENLKGDLAMNYKTIPVIYGIKFAKFLITGFGLLTMVPIMLLIFNHDIGKMDLFFYFSVPVLLFYLVYLWVANSKKQYVILHTLLKLILVIGAFSIVLIKPELILSRINF